MAQNVPSGSCWVEGTEFHYIDAAGLEWYIVGSAAGSVPGQIGSMWLDPATQNLCYIDSSHQKRVLPSATSASGVAGRPSLWVELSNFQYVDDNHVKKRLFSHSDSHSDDAHGDVSFGDFPHQDFNDTPPPSGTTSFRDVPHTNRPHSDSPAHDDFSDATWPKRVNT